MFLWEICLFITLLFYGLYRFYAADQGHADSQFILGLMYKQGLGVRQNQLQAKEWFGKACDNGNQCGCDNYRLLNA